MCYRSASKGKGRTTRWDGVAKRSPDKDPFSDLSCVKGDSFTTPLHSRLHTLDASRVGPVGKGERPIPFLVNDSSKQATFEMQGSPQASINFLLAERLATVPQDM